MSNPNIQPLPAAQDFIGPIMNVPNGPVAPPSDEPLVNGSMNRNAPVQPVNPLPMVAALNNPPTVTPPEQESEDRSLSEIEDSAENILLELLTHGNLLKNHGPSIVPAAESVISKLTLCLQSYPDMLPLIMSELTAWRRFLPNSPNFLQEAVSLESIAGERIHQSNIQFYGDTEKFGLFHVDGPRVTAEADFDTERTVSANSIDLVFNRVSGPMFLVSRLADYLSSQTKSVNNEKWLTRVVFIIWKLVRCHTSNILLQRATSLTDALKIFQKGQSMVNAIVMKDDGLAPSERLDCNPVLLVESGVAFMMSRVTLADELSAEVSSLDPSSSSNQSDQSSPTEGNESEKEEDSIADRTRSLSRKTLRAEIEKMDRRLSAVERILGERPRKNQNQNRNNNRSYGQSRRSRSRSPANRNFMKTRGRYQK